jgi:chitodextrinase
MLSRVVVLLGVLVFLGLLAGPPVGSASVTNLWASDDVGLALNHFDPTDVLYVSGTNSFTGAAYVCVVPASQTSGACPGAWGQTLVVTPGGFGLAFYGVLLSPPPLVRGEWRILGDNGPDPASDIVSQPFEVSCEHSGCNVPPAVTPDLRAAMKHAAQGSLIGHSLGCGLMAALSVAVTAVPTYAFLVVSGFPLGAGATIAISLGAGVAAAALPATDPRDIAMGALFSYFCKNAKETLPLVADPPDPNYTLIAQPARGVIPPGGDSRFSGLLDELNWMQANTQALLHSVERFDGASEANDTDFMRLQAVAAGQYALEISRALRGAADEARALASALATEGPEFTDPLLSQDEIDDLLVIHTRLSTSGFTTDEIAILQDAGFSTEQIAEALEALSQDFSGTPAGISRLEALEQIAAAYENAIAGFDFVGRSYSAIADTLAASANRPPVAVDDTLDTARDTAGTLDVLANDSDPDGDPLTVAGSTNGINGIVSCSAAGSCTYTPELMFTGNDSFTYTISDGRGGTSTASVAVTVLSPGNRSPVAVADTGETVGATPATIDVLANDTDPDGDELTVTGTRSVFRGTASCTPTGSCTYTPNPDFTSGEGSFIYDIADGRGGTASATVRITIRSTRPTAAFTAAPTQGFRSVTVSFDASASSDANGTIETYRWEFGDGATATGPIVEHTYEGRGTYNAFLTVTDDDGETGISGRQIFVTTEQDLDLPICGDADGSETPFQRPCPAPFTYTEDVQLFRVPGTGSVDVRFDFIDRAAALANELVAVRVDDGSGSIDGLLPGEDGYSALALERAQVVFPGGSGAATPDVTMRFTGGDFLVFGIAQASLAQLRLNNPSNSAVNGNSAFFSLMALNPDGIQHMVGWEQQTGGFVQFSFEDLLGGGDFDYDDITWNVYGLQPLAPESSVGPESTDDTLVTDEDTTGQRDVLANDTGPSLTVVAFTQGAHGTVSCAQAGICTYTPMLNYSGPDSFTYTASNVDGDDTATVHVTINPVNDPPDAVGDSASTPQGVAKDVSVLANDSDPDGNTLSVAGNTQGANGTVSCTAAGICAYTPSAGYVGPDSFTYTVSDGHGGTATATVGITVTPVSQVGVSGKGVFNTGGNGKVTFTLSSTAVKLAQSSGRKFTFDGTVASAVGGAGTATVTGSGKWNGASGYTFEITVVDRGSPGYRKGDTITVVIRNPSGSPVFSWGPERLKTGDIVVTAGSSA